MASQQHGRPELVRVAARRYCFAFEVDPTTGIVTRAAPCVDWQWPLTRRWSIVGMDWADALVLIARRMGPVLVLDTVYPSVVQIDCGRNG